MGNRTVFGVVGAIAMVAAACGSTSGDGDVAAPPVEEKVTDAASAGTGGLGNEGIEVHGQWKVDVVNADGSVERTVEFENALVGQQRIARILGREITPSQWSITIRHEDFAGGDHPCEDGSGSAAGCNIVENADSRPNYFDNLTVSVEGTGGSTQLVLAGSAIMQRDGTISLVRSNLEACPSTEDPVTCAAAGGSVSGINNFTEKTASESTTDDFEPVAVTAGQQVQVAVTLSFS